MIFSNTKGTFPWIRFKASRFQRANNYCTTIHHRSVHFAKGIHIMYCNDFVWTKTKAIQSFKQWRHWWYFMNFNRMLIKLTLPQPLQADKLRYKSQLQFSKSNHKQNTQFFTPLNSDIPSFTLQHPSCQVGTQPAWCVTSLAINTTERPSGNSGLCSSNRQASIPSFGVLGLGPTASTMWPLTSLVSMHGIYRTKNRGHSMTPTPTK